MCSTSTPCHSRSDATLCKYVEKSLVGSLEIFFYFNFLYFNLRMPQGGWRFYIVFRIFPKQIKSGFILFLIVIHLFIIRVSPYILSLVYLCISTSDVFDASVQKKLFYAIYGKCSYSDNVFHNIHFQVHHRCFYCLS